MFHVVKASAAVALCCAMTGLVSGCGLLQDSDQEVSDAASTHPIGDGALVGTTKIVVDGKSVTVSCTGSPKGDRPVVVLMAGLGDGVDKLADFQQTLSQRDRVCSYDRLGEGTSDLPDGPQSFDSSGKVLTAVLDRVAGRRPVVLAAHSLGGLIAARYTPHHTDRVKGLVLMDATPSTIVADTTTIIPADATGPAADLRAQSLAVYQGDNPEKLAIADGKVDSAGGIPVEVIQHGQQYLAAIPEYGPALEKAWSEGQHKWLALSRHSTLSTAATSGHYIYVDQPDIAVQAINRVVAKVAD